MSKTKKEQKALMPEPTELAAEETSLVSTLEELMSNTVVLYFAAHRAHWNVTGQDFSEYHGLFEEIYSDVYDAIDPLAEHIRKMGEFPEALDGMLSDAAFKDDSMTTDAKSLAADLLLKNAAVLAMFKAAFEIANSANEQGIANFMAERIDMHEKWDWQLKASIGIGSSMPAEQEDTMKSLIGKEVSWTDVEGDNIGIVIEFGDDECVYVQKCMELEGMEVTNDICFVPVKDVKLRTFIVSEKVDGDLSDGAIVSWETSNGSYYGDIQSSSTDGAVRGEPQGLEIEGTTERPAYIVRVWQEGDAEWEPTNVTIVAYGDHLKVEDQLPQSQEDDTEEPKPEDVPSEETMPSRAPKGGGKKNMDLQAITDLVVKEVVKAIAAMDATIEEAKSDEVATEEVAVEEVVAAEEVAAEDVVTEVAAETATEEVAAEVVEAAEAAEVVAEAAAEEVVEEKSFISFDELKEFHDLIKVL